jgi:hypothetical protein
MVYHPIWGYSRHILWFADATLKIGILHEMMQFMPEKHDFMPEIRHSP